MPDGQRKEIKMDEKTLQGYQVALLDEIAERLLEIKTLTVPEGIVENINDFTIEGTLPQQVKPTKPWFSFTLTNNGPDAVYVTVNKRGGDRYKVDADKTYEVDMKAAKIMMIYLACAIDESATVDISAVR